MKDLNTMKSCNDHFIKVTKNAHTPLSLEQKATLNRRGNKLLNEGLVEEAKRIFLTTGYSDGLTRVGDYHAKNGSILEALRMYCLAKNKRKSEPIIDSLVQLIRTLVDIEKKE